MKKDFMSSMKEKTAVLRPSLLSTEEHIKQQIRILDELRQLIPPLKDDEFDQLKQNLLRHGVKDPLTVWETTSTVAGIDEQDEPAFILIDGHNRYTVCRQYNLDYRINLIRFSSLAEVKDYMIDYQLGRRNLTGEQISYLRGLRYLQQKSMRGGTKHADSSQVDVSVTLGKEYGVSSRTIKRDGDFAAGLNKLAPELKQQVLSGEKKIPKSVLTTAAKIGTVDLISGVDELLNPAPIEVPVSVPESKLSAKKTEIKALEISIRHLASGTLTAEICRELGRKAQQLIRLLGAK